MKRKIYKYTITLIAKDINEAYEGTLNYISKHPQIVKNGFTVEDINP